MIQLIASGIATGALYSLVGVSLVIVYRASGVLNFAQGDMAAVPLFLAFALLTESHVPYVLVVVIVLAASLLEGALVYYLLIRPLERRPALTIVMATFGLSLMLNAAVVYLWGSNERGFPPAIHGSELSLLGADLTPAAILAVVVAVCVVLVGNFLLLRTRAGLIMRAANSNRIAAQLMGINQRRVTLAAWMISAALGLVAALLLAPSVGLDPQTTDNMLLISFAAIVLGGLGSIPGAIVGGIVIGVIRNLVAGYITLHLQTTFLFGVILLILTLRPTGLLGRGGELRSAVTATFHGGSQRLRALTIPHRASVAAQTGLAVLVVLIVIAAPDNSVGPIDANVLLLCVATVPAVLSVTLLTGISGQLSIGQAAFMAVGAYSAALLCEHVTADAFIACAGGVLVAAVFGVLMAVPALRIRGPYLALVTLAFTWAVPEVLNSWTSVTGGFVGLYVTVHSFAGISVSGTSSMFYTMTVFVAIVAGAVWLLLRSPLGRRWRAIRDDEAAAASIGVGVASHKVAAFAISAGLAGLAGGLMATASGYVSPDGFTVNMSIYLLVAAVLGGLESVAGAIIGAVVIVALPVVLGSANSALPQLIFGAALIFTVLLMPRGLSGLIEVRRAVPVEREPLPTPELRDSVEAPS